VTFLFCTKTICLGTTRRRQKEGISQQKSAIRSTFISDSGKKTNKIRWERLSPSKRTGRVGVGRKRRSRERSVSGTGFGSDLLDLVSLG